MELTDPNVLMFGGSEGVLGPTISWIIGAIGAVIAMVAVLNARRSKQRHGFMVKPVWAEAVLIALIVAVVLGFILLLNSCEIPPQKLKRLAVVVGAVFKRHRCGPVFNAIGGNEDAASAAGINAGRMIWSAFVFAVLLTGLAGVLRSGRPDSA